MNIFEVLSQGKSRLHEPSISAMLGYLLNSNKDHGLGDVYLREFLKLIQDENKSINLNSIINTSFINTDVSLEEPYTYKNSRKDIDVQISILNKEKKEIYRLIVENKIKTGAANQNQLNDYYNAILEDDKEIEHLIMIFITPDVNHNKLTSEFENLTIKENHFKVWLKWNGLNRCILESLKILLEKEMKAEISPINEYVRHTIKAFITYLNNVIESSSRKKIRFNEDLGEITDNILVKLEKDEYRIIRRTSAQIQVYKEEEKVEAKAVLRKIITNYMLELPSNTTEPNTRQLGKKVIDELRRKGVCEEG